MYLYMYILLAYIRGYSHGITTIYAVRIVLFLFRCRVSIGRCIWVGLPVTTSITIMVIRTRSNVSRLLAIAMYGGLTKMKLQFVHPFSIQGLPNVFKLSVFQLFATLLNNLGPQLFSDGVLRGSTRR